MALLMKKLDAPSKLSQINKRLQKKEANSARKKKNKRNKEGNNKKRCKGAAAATLEDSRLKLKNGLSSTR